MKYILFGRYVHDLMLLLVKYIIPFNNMYIAGINTNKFTLPLS